MNYIEETIDELFLRIRRVSKGYTKFKYHNEFIDISWDWDYDNTCFVLCDNIFVLRFNSHEMHKHDPSDDISEDKKELYVNNLVEFVEELSVLIKKQMNIRLIEIL